MGAKIYSCEDSCYIENERNQRVSSTHNAFINLMYCTHGTLCLYFVGNDLNVNP